jgi:hypothetical protein
VEDGTIVDVEDGTIVDVEDGTIVDVEDGRALRISRLILGGKLSLSSLLVSVSSDNNVFLMLRCLGAE